MKVEDLLMHGKAFDMPKEGLRKQKKVVLNLLRKEFGIPGLIRIKRGIKKHSKRIANEYPQAVGKAKNISEIIAKELIIMGALFFAIADKRGKVFAKEFMTHIAKNIAPVSIPGMYKLNKLVKCEGDVFENFIKFNYALFAEIHRIGAWKNRGFNETEDLLEIKLSTCINVDFFEAIACPELKTLGCDHDLVGYPLIEEAVQCEFRRPCTIAKGGKYCHFQFYRKGTAPETGHLNQ